MSFPELAGPVVGADPLIQGISHSILAYLFTEKYSEPDQLRRFYYYFDVYATLVIWKVSNSSLLLSSEAYVAAVLTS